LENAFPPGSFIDATMRDHDLTGFRSSPAGLAMHVAAFPEANDLLFARSQKSIDFSSLDEMVWGKRAFITPSIDVSEKLEKSTLAARLWDVSEQILKDFEEKKSTFLSEPVVSSSAVLNF